MAEEARVAMVQLEQAHHLQLEVAMVQLEQAHGNQLKDAEQRVARHLAGMLKPEPSHGLAHVQPRRQRAAGPWYRGNAETPGEVAWCRRVPWFIYPQKPTTENGKCSVSVLVLA